MTSLRFPLLHCGLQLPQQVLEPPQLLAVTRPITRALRFHRRDQMGPAERYLSDAVYEDLTRYRPDILMVLRHARDSPENAIRRVDYVAYFERDARIAEVLRRYRLAEEVGHGGQRWAQP